MAGIWWWGRWYKATGLRGLITRGLITPLRVALALWASMVAAIVVWFADVLLTGHDLHTPFHEIVAPDFAIFWAAGRVATTLPPSLAWDWHTVTHEIAQSLGRDALVGGTLPPLGLTALESDAVGWKVAWNYLPPALLPMMALSQLPYGWAVVVWLSVSVLAWGLSAWQLWPRADAVVVALLYPATVVALMAGQLSLLLTACLCAGLMRVNRQPWVAGGLLAVVAVKPTLALAIPLAVITAGQWRVLAAMALWGLGMAGLATVLLGFDVWPAFLANVSVVDGWTRVGLVPLHRLVSPWAWVMAHGWRSDMANLWQAMATTGAVAVIVWAWRPEATAASPYQRSLLLAKSAVLLTALPYLPYYLFEYDLVVLGGAIILLWRLGHDRTLPGSGPLRGEAACLCLTWLLTAWPPQISALIGYYPAGIAMIALILCAIRRLKHLRNKADESP